MLKKKKDSGQAKSHCSKKTKTCVIITWFPLQDSKVLFTVQKVYVLSLHMTLLIIIKQFVHNILKAVWNFDLEEASYITLKYYNRTSVILKKKGLVTGQTYQDLSTRKCLNSIFVIKEQMQGKVEIYPSHKQYNFLLKYVIEWTDGYERKFYKYLYIR